MTVLSSCRARMIGTSLVVVVECLTFFYDIHLISILHPSIEPSSCGTRRLENVFLAIQANASPFVSNSIPNPNCSTNSSWAAKTKRFTSTIHAVEISCRPMISIWVLLIQLPFWTRASGLYLPLTTRLYERGNGIYLW